ncbi:hypothetical protein HGM15179_021248, partial [Zosterops borbonicus]
SAQAGEATVTVKDWRTIPANWEIVQYSGYGMGYIRYNVLPKGEFSGFLDQEDSGCHSLQAFWPALGNIV